MSTTYTTLADFIDREIVPAITGVEDDFDVQGFTRALQDLGRIEYVIFPGAVGRNGFRWAGDPLGGTDCDPLFWDLVEQFDAAAVAARS